MDLGERQKLILALVIRDYIENAQPIGSKTLVDRYGLTISPATVRNEMAVLTEAGLLRQPHTSAGREPTEDGYRYFVRQLMGQTDLAPQTKRMITHQFYQAGHDVDHSRGGRAAARRRCADTCGRPDTRYVPDNGERSQ